LPGDRLEPWVVELECDRESFVRSPSCIRDAHGVVAHLTLQPRTVDQAPGPQGVACRPGGERSREPVAHHREVYGDRRPLSPGVSSEESQSAGSVTRDQPRQDRGDVRELLAYPSVGVGDVALRREVDGRETREVAGGPLGRKVVLATLAELLCGEVQNRLEQSIAVSAG